ncbi:TonB-dependent siderophore receptor [Novosphingobium profundi]|uniref:TonB-dependent siderophore receptor n=1 Tax=Novosphingobium profundi TaxID=1774954 RepID=UPI001BDB6396|nr:TonB-dependent siderophore receptor [Novosphingobium profundi]MBT0667111.1 TonB-dependent siderophore receptor [Novosphingobium profundi]
MRGTALAALAAAAMLASHPALAEADAKSDAPDDRIIVTGAIPDDYTVTGQSTSSRLDLSLRETPQSTTTITRAQIEDFNLDTINDVLLMTPGVNVERAETTRTYYNARGFDIVNFQFDGIGQQLPYGLQVGAVDTATYERVEVVRGSTGLTSLTGNPSATVNFVRKRAGTETGGHASLSYGSYDNVRGDVDVNAALTESGSLRARFVGSYVDGDSHLDFYHESRMTLYGTVSADLGPDTVATVGYSWQESDPRGVTWGGVPFLDAEGNMMSYARSTTTAQPWTSWESISRDIFGDVTHDFGNGWTGKLSAFRRVRDLESKLFYLYGNQDENGDGLYSWPGAYKDREEETTFDAHVTGQFNLFGRQHDLVLGANYGEAKLWEYEATDDALIGLPLTQEQAFGGTFPTPDFGDYNLQAAFTTKTYGGYGTLRLSLAEPLKLLLGANLTRSERVGQSYGTPNYFATTRFLPFAGVTLDLTGSLTAYASYATIFNPQIYMREDGSMLDPLEGKTYEAGIKGEWLEGKLNAAIAIYKTDQQNVAETDGVISTVTGQYAYTQVDNSSRGVEFDISGQPLPGLQVTGGYAYVDIEDAQGNDARSFIPRHTIRFSTVYTPPAFDILRLGASVRYQSRVTNDGAYQDEYAVVDLLARLALTRNVSLGVNIDNVTNAKYWQSIQWAQGLYDAPRTWRATLGVSF